MKIIKSEDIAYPQRLLKIKDYPKQIYALGNIELLNFVDTIGIVGSRNCTEYGRKVAQSFANELSKNGICIISGMAVGIDASSHFGAIRQKGKTIAVLGSGLSCIYPEENEWLFHKILTNGGCIISEYEPNVEKESNNFPKRNRIISALSDGVLVVEAEFRSGSSITAKYAKEQGKNLYAIPSNIYSMAGIGTNKMIQEGAKLVTKASQIIKDLKNKEDLKKQKENNNIKEKVINENERVLKNTKKIPKEYQEIYNLLSDNPIHINEISKILNKQVHQISSLITMMELEGYILQIQTNEFIKSKEERCI